MNTEPSANAHSCIYKIYENVKGFNDVSHNDIIIFKSESPSEPAAKFNFIYFGGDIQV